MLGTLTDFFKDWCIVKKGACNVVTHILTLICEIFRDSLFSIILLHFLGLFPNSNGQKWQDHRYKPMSNSIQQYSDYQSIRLQYNNINNWVENENTNLKHESKIKVIDYLKLTKSFSLSVYSILRVSCVNMHWESKIHAI